MIIEERLFNVAGQCLAWTKTPIVTDLKRYRQILGTRVVGISFHRYEGKRGVCFLLNDGRILIVILGRAEAMAGTMTPATREAIAAD